MLIEAVWTPLHVATKEIGPHYALVLPECLMAEVQREIIRTGAIDDEERHGGILAKQYEAAVAFW